MKAIKSLFAGVKSFFKKASITNAEIFALVVIVILYLLAKNITPDIVGLLNSVLLPTIMMNIGLAFITMLIPIAIFFFSSSRQNLLFEWDKTIILDKVIKTKGLLWSMGAIFLPLLIWDLKFSNWDYSNLTIRIVSFSLFVVGFIYLVEILIRAYLWIKIIETPGESGGDNFRNKLRYEYLDSLNNWDEKEKIWSLTWREDNINIIDERNLLKKFLSNVNYLIKNNLLDKSARYLTIFKTYLDKRIFRDWIIFGDFLSSILDWHKIISEKEQEEKEDTSSIWELESSLEELIQKSVTIGLKNGTSYLLFKDIEKHIRHEDYKYSEDLFHLISFLFFENVADSPKKHSIWRDNFPEEWKITIIWCLEGSKDKKKFIPAILFVHFLQWLQGRLTEVEGEFDEKLELVAKELFPDTDPFLWAKILTLIYRPFNKTRIQSLIDNPLNFGLTGRVTVYWNEDNWKQKKQRQMTIEENDTIEMALQLFKGYFTDDQLIQHIKELEMLKYPKDLKKETRRKYLLKIFRKMLLRTVKQKKE